MLAEKRTLSLEEIEGQTAVELPDRHMMALVKVKLLNGNTVIVSPDVAANLCGINVLTILSKNVTFCKQVAKA